MASTSGNKRKAGSTSGESASKKNNKDVIRIFSDVWTEEYAFVLRHGKPECLICRQTVAIIKKTNIKRHFDAKHCESFNRTFPANSNARKEKITALKAGLASEESVMLSFTSLEKCGTEASMRVSKILAKAMVPYSHADLVKTCMVELTQTLFPDKQDIIEKVKGVQLSRNTCTKRTEEISQHLFQTLKAALFESDCFSIALDESTDVMDVAQMSVFVRFFNGEIITEELLTLIGLEGDTTGLSIHTALVKKFADMGIPLEKCVSITTDGAPAMVGKEQGLIWRLKKDMKSLMAFHCIIHQTVLCGKLNGAFQELMTNAMKLTNFLKSKSALRHRKLRHFLRAENADYDDLLTHNNVRWLSKANALARIWALREELTSFLTQCSEPSAEPFKEMMQSTADLANLAFLVDICGHLNQLNLKLQGKGKSVLTLHSDVNSFHLKLQLYTQDLDGDLLHFPTLKTLLSEIETEDEMETRPTAHFIAFVKKMHEEFQQRFSQFRALSHVIQLVKSPLTSKTDGEWKTQVQEIPVQLSVAEIQLELCEMQGSETGPDDEVERFWTNPVISAQYPNISKLAVYLLTIFASTYLCESGFSYMNHIKNKLRSVLIQEHLHQLLQISCCSREPNYDQILDGKKQYQASH